MSKAAKAPVENTANAEEKDLPLTAVRPSAKEQALFSLQEKLAQYVDNEDAVEPIVTTVTEPVNGLTSSEEETFKKRYGDLRRHSQQKEEQSKRELTQLKTQVEQLTSASKQVMPKTKEEFEEWKAKYPDIAVFIEMIADEKAGQRTAKLQEELGSVKETLVTTEKDKARAILKTEVPDYEELYSSADFKTWLEDQPKAVADTVSTSDDPYDVAKVFKAFKKSTSKIEPAKKAKEDKLAALDTSVKHSGVSPSNNKAWKFSESQIAAMSAPEFEKYEAEIIAARNSGLIFPDMTKKNTVFDI